MYMDEMIPPTAMTGNIVAIKHAGHVSGQYTGGALKKGRMESSICSLEGGGTARMAGAGRVAWLLLQVLTIMAGPALAAAGTPQLVPTRSDGLCRTHVVANGLPYLCTEYMVPTEDGFLLGVQRVTSQTATMLKGAVFLMHGILMAGSTWFLNSPSQSLGFILADAGYDVWIGNTRTTKFGYGHSQYQRKDEEFWDWSVDEMAKLDLPAMLSWAYQIVGHKVHYIGYSQGSQQAFAAFSEGLGLSYIDRVIMIAPIAYVDRGKTPIEVGLFHLPIYKIFKAPHIYEINPHVVETIVDVICHEDLRCYKDWFSFFAGRSCCLNSTRMGIIERNEAESTSLKNLAHLSQQGKSSTFTKYDYKAIGNLKLYGTISPPSYNLSNIPTENMLLIYGLQDDLADSLDVERLKSELGRGDVQTYTSPTFGHLDFICAEVPTTRFTIKCWSSLQALSLYDVNVKVEMVLDQHFCGTPYKYHLSPLFCSKKVL